MSWPVPKVGQIIRYSYLWKAEADQGQEEGVKNRPCVIVVAVETREGTTRVVVAPITHTPPSAPADGLAVPIATARRCGLDERPQWVSLVDLNRFIWPGPDLRPLPGAGLSSVLMGAMPAALVQTLITRLQHRIRAGQSTITTRTDV